MSVRAVVAAVAAVVCVFQLVVVSLGYAEIGSYVALATYRQIDPYRSQVVEVTPEGERAGLRSGDVVDLREMSQAQRLALGWSYWRAGTVFPTTVHRNNTTLIVDQPVRALRDIKWYTVLDVVERIILFAIGILLIARGAGAVGLWGGVALIGIGLQQGYAFSWGGAPIAVGVAAMLLSSSGYVFGFVGRHLFGLALLPEHKQESLKKVLTWVFSALFAFLMVGLAERRIYLFTGFAFANSYNLFQLAQLLLHVYFVALFAIVALRATGQNAGSMRVLFWSYLLGVSGLVANTVYGVLYGTVPFDGVLNITFLLSALGFAYIVFARELFAVNFYISKAAIYTIVLAVVIGVFILLERLIELLALNRAPSLILELAVPLVLGLSVRGIERFAERVVERVLYREKLQAEEQLEALIADFPHARDVDSLTRCVVDDIHRLLHVPAVTLYCESALGYAAVATIGTRPATVAPDDRAFLRMRSTLRPVHLHGLGSDVGGALAFPLVVVGKLTGALVLSARSNHEPYDPDEVAILSKLAHELAVTLLWAGRETATVPAGLQLP